MLDGARHGSSRDHHVSRKRLVITLTNAFSCQSSRRDEHRDRERGSGRRRSRSPGHRGGSRRDYEVDSYSTSRDYREREREDRFQRRDERGWDRDRGSSRREERRDDGDRPPRRDRGDLFDDRRGGGGGGRRGDRDGFGGGGGRGGRDGGMAEQRKKSASPPPKKKEPTPDLTDIVSVLERKRRLTQWDLKPVGYENVTAEQAKLSGMFPLPGAPRAQPMDPSRLQAFMNQPSGSASNAALKPSNARQSKRLFVSNLPSAATDESLTEFFNLQLNGLNVVSAVDPCMSAQISHDRAFAMLEFKAPEDATVALAMDGITMEADDHANGNANGSSSGLSIKRPKDYIVPPPAESTDEQPSGLWMTVPDSVNKICVSNLPPYLTEEQVTELLVSFGELKSFILVKDTGTEQSRVCTTDSHLYLLVPLIHTQGIAFCEYAEPKETDIAVVGLNGMELGAQHLRVVRANVGVTQAAGLEMSVNAMSVLAGTTSTELEQGRVIQLLNMVTAEELIDNEDYAEICEDVKEECEKYGRILGLKIPRPSGGGRATSGVGKIFIKYETAEAAQKALKALAGRKFADRTVVVTFFGEVSPLYLHSRT